MHQYPWICLNIFENASINCSNYARAINMHDHLTYLTGFWRKNQFVVSKPLRNYFEETTGFEVMAWFARPVLSSVAQCCFSSKQVIYQKNAGYSFPWNVLWIENYKLNTHQYFWICLNIIEKTWINRPDYARALNMHDHFMCSTGFWRCLEC